jgi:ribosomal protein L21E
MARTDELVEVDQPGHVMHGKCGQVVAKRGTTYTVQFVNDGPTGPRYLLERFEGLNLRAIIRVRV